jgi:L,D-peptidoglycan transpeptidase YkuD (ErfK/YbiS/YcfS/YnhG family)
MPITALLRHAALACCAMTAAHAATPERDAWRDARQLVLVTTADWNAAGGTLRTYARDDDGAWHSVGEPVTVTIGRAGSAWGLGLHGAHDGPVKREGDGRSPAGAFRLGDAFGYAASAQTALPYIAMQATHWCVDVAASPLYNRIVDTRVVGDAAIAGSTEPMRRDIHADGDVRYRAGFVIAHNAHNVPNAGSCIFAHLWRTPGEATSGCTAMDEPAMQRLYAWLAPELMPVFVLLPQHEYATLRAGWRLPDLTETP